MMCHVAYIKQFTNVINTNRLINQLTLTSTRIRRGKNGTCTSIHQDIRNYRLHVRIV